MQNSKLFQRSPDKAVLGNLTNSHSPNILSPQLQSPQNQQSFAQSPLKQQPTEKQNQQQANYEQENQVLKSQIEMLKAALLDICKDKHLHLPSIAPILWESNNLSLNEQQQENMYHHRSKAGGLSPFQPIQLKSFTPLGLTRGQRFSPKKSQQTKQTSKEAPLFQNENGSQISQINQSNSPIKSMQRRKRAQRASPGNSQKLQQTQAHLESPHFNEELPLQMSKKSVGPTEDTLFLDKTIEVAQVRLDEGATNHDDCDNLNLYSKDEDNKDTSQIQIKYAKMLEELENDSIDDIPICSSKTEDHKEQLRSQMTIVLQTQQEEEVTCYPMQMSTDKSLISQGGTRHKKKKSSQYEQKQFYEQELHNLKSELEQFTQEEEKLLQMLVVPDASIDETVNIVFTTFNNKEQHQNERQQINQNDCMKADEVVYKRQKNLEFFKTVDNQQSLCKYTQDDQTIQRNLEEAIQVINDNLDDLDDPYRMIIKPIRIESPIRKEAADNYCVSQQITMEREAKLQQTVSPRRRNQGSCISMDSISDQTIATQRNTYLCKSPYYEKGTHQRMVDESPFIPSSQIRNEKQGRQSTSILHSAKSSESRRSMKYSNLKSVLHKEPSSFMNNLLDNMVIHSNKYISPVSHVMQVKHYPQNEYISAYASKSNQSGSKPKLSEVQMSQEKMQQIVKLAQQQKSLANGLRQQEEEPQSEEEVNDCISLKITINSNLEGFQSPQTQVAKVIDQDNYETESNQNEHSMYFGLYSLEKSEELKNQRAQSIRKAEELLLSFMSDHPERKRPTFQSSFTKCHYEEPLDEVVVEEFDEVEVQVLEDQSNQSDEQLQVEFVEEKSNVLPIDEITPYKQTDESDEEEQQNAPTQYPHTAHYYDGVVNLEIITPSKSDNCRIFQYNKELEEDQKIDHNLVDIQKDDYSSFDVNHLISQNSHTSERSQSPPAKSYSNNGYCSTAQKGLGETLQQVDVQDFNQTAMVKNIIKQFNESDFKNPFLETQYLQPQIINNRRKSVESKLSSTAHLMSNPAKKNSVQNRKIAQQLQQKAQKEDFYQLKTSNSCEKHPPKQTLVLNNTLSESSTLIGKLPQAEAKNRLTGDYIPNMASADAEYFYQQRSKSVVKRREELLRKKQEESRLKMEAKYKKIDKLKQTRNMFRVPSNSKYGATIMQQQQSQQVESVCSKSQVSHNQYQSKERLSHKKSVLSKDENLGSDIKDQPLSSNSIVELKNKTILPIMFEKRLRQKNDSICTVPQQQKNQVVPQQYPSITPFQQSTPVAKGPSIYQPRSKVTSQCTSYRNKEDAPHQSNRNQRQLQNTSQNEFNTRSKERRLTAAKTPVSGVLYKQKLQNQHGFKQSILNKNLRIPNKSRDSQCTQQDSLQSQVKQQTINYDKSQSIIHQSHSFLTGNGVLSLAKQEVATSSRSTLKPLPQQQVPLSYHTIQAEAAEYNQKQKICDFEDQNKPLSCMNCQRLKLKGLSTDFCLDHYELSPRYVDE